jgi:hypothetical protein
LWCIVDAAGHCRTPCRPRPVRRCTHAVRLPSTTCPCPMPDQPLSPGCKHMHVPPVVCAGPSTNSVGHGGQASCTHPDGTTCNTNMFATSDLR